MANCRAQNEADMIAPNSARFHSKYGLSDPLELADCASSPDRAVKNTADGPCHWF
jgi:hypothetical protein